MEIDKPIIVAVLGMHRSGTSMMGGILNSLGMSPGSADRLFLDQYNVKGYFEDLEIILCNEKILSSQVNRTIARIHDSDSFLDKATLDGFGWLYGAWLDPEMRDEDNEENSKFIKSALSTDIEKSEHKKLRFIKDPRMSLTLNNWSREITFDAAIVMVRNPESVVKSLLNRDHIIDCVGYDLWQLYTYNALLNVQQIPHLVVDYDEFLFDKQRTLDTLLKFLGNAIGFTPFDKAKKGALLSIEQDLNHKHTNPSVNQPPEKIIALYERIRNGNIDGLKDEFKHRFKAMNDNWMAALYVAEKNKRIFYTSKFRERIDRLNKHVIVGNVLSLLRRIKKDQTFGTFSDL